MCHAAAALSVALCATFAVAWRPSLASAVAQSGFDIEAHDAIGQTAASAMDQEAIKPWPKKGYESFKKPKDIRVFQTGRQIKRMMSGQDASDVAGWGHQAAVRLEMTENMSREVDDTYPDMARLHFQVHDDDAGFCGGVRKAKCEDNICLLASIKHFYGKVVSDEGRRMDFPAIDYSKVAKGIKFSDADYLKMLINLVGDLHQQLYERADSYIL